jgi:hypothetical protein
MAAEYRGNENHFDRQFQFISAASLWVAWYEMTTLWPLEREERKEFRKKFLLKVSAVIDDTLRSGPFLEMLRRFSEPYPMNQTTDRPAETAGKTSASNSRANEAMEEAFRELMKVMKENAGGIAEPREPASHAGGTNEAQMVKPESAAQNGRSEMAGLERNRAKCASPAVLHQAAEGDTAGSSQTARNGELSERLVRELQETNTRLRELLTLQREVLERTAATEQKNYGKSTNGS